MHNKAVICIPAFWRKNIELFCEHYELTPSELMRRSIRYSHQKISSNPHINWQMEFKKQTRELKKFRGQMTASVGSYLPENYIQYVEEQCKLFNAPTSSVIRFDLDLFMTNIKSADLSYPETNKGE